MLKILEITNIALIESLRVEFAPGMNCLTGETGAGKTILLDAICALLGSRTSRELIRSGTESGRVYGEFTGISEYTRAALKRCGIPEPEGDTLCMEREMTAAGRNLCRVAGHPVPTAILKQIGETLVDIHGQHDNQSLMRPDSHIRLLDAFGAPELTDPLNAYKQQLEIYKGLQKELEALSGDPAARERTMDLLRYQIREIEAAQLSENEEAELAARKELITHAEKIYANLNRAAAIAESDGRESVSALSVLNDLKTALSAVAEFGDVCRSLSESAESLYYEAEDLAQRIQNALQETVFDPEEAEWVRERLDYLQKLKRKYGGSVPEILQFGREAESRLEFLLSSEENAERITEQLAALSDTLYALCEDISFTRKKISVELEKKIGAELRDLEMSAARFAVDQDFSYETDALDHPVFGKNGLDRIEFLISANPGEPLLPLARIASGGELSRIMLAIKTALNEGDRIATMIFDEIDTGVSGIAARRIAEKLRFLSEQHQVICVTHHAQIAAAAQRNLYVSKSVSSDRTFTHVRVLSDEEKIHEISRLLDGESESAITNEHAKNLIERYS